MTRYVTALRIRHWIKNLFLFAAPFFGGSLSSQTVLSFALPAFIAFSFASSAVYIFNDIQDIEYDKRHPKKKKRPVTSGAINKKSAYVTAFILAGGSSVLSLWISPHFFSLVIIYIFIHAVYSLGLKNIPVIDLLCIASGFLLRVLAGGAAFHVDVSAWLLLTMFTISLVLASGKRIGETIFLDEQAMKQRRALKYYSQSVLKAILLVSASASLIAYVMYTLEQHEGLIYTVPIVVFGLFRYIVLARKGFGDPTEAMTKDKWLALTVLVWLFVIALIRYN